MLKKLKRFFTNKDELMEMLRYIVAGGLTTLISLIIIYGMEFVLATSSGASLQLVTPYTFKTLLLWFIGVVNLASKFHIMLSTLVSWIISVIFAFWINRKMVFRVKDKSKAQITKEFLQFVGARVVSFLLIEEAVALLLNVIGITNVWNRLIIQVLVVVFNYVASKFWIFNKKNLSKTE